MRYVSRKKELKRIESFILQITLLDSLMKNSGDRVHEVVSNSSVLDTLVTVVRRSTSRYDHEYTLVSAAALDCIQVGIK